MGKNKKIRNLQSEVDRLRKNVIDREVAIDKLLSDEITDQEKNVIKLERHFAKAIAAEFDKYLLSGKTTDYSKVSEVISAGTFTPTDKQKADVEVHRDKFLNNMNIYNKETNLVDKPNFIQSAGRQYRHTEEADKLYVEFSINHGDKFVKSVEWGGDGVIKTKITYPDADGAPKTMVDIHDDINFMETIAKMPGCTFQKADYNEKYIFLSDYHISSPYIDEDIVIKEGTIISLLRGNTYGSENTMVLFPYQNVKLMEEKGLVRRLSPLEICGEPQVCAPAKED